MKTKAPILVKGKVVIQRPELTNKKSHKPTASEADCGCGGDMKKQSGGAIDKATVAKASMVGTTANMISNKKAKQAVNKASEAVNTLTSNAHSKGLKATAISAEPKQRGLLYKCGGGMKKSNTTHNTPKKQAGGPLLPVPGIHRASSYVEPIHPMAERAIQKAPSRQPIQPVNYTRAIQKAPAVNRYNPNSPADKNLGPGPGAYRKPISPTTTTSLPAMTSEERAYMAGVLRKRQEDRAKLESSRQNGR
jgi:hypothetical protein